jgi:hypothetical protein
VKTTSYKLEDASEFLRVVVHGSGRITSYLLDGSARMGTCFPTLGQMIEDNKATLTTRSKTGEDGQPTPTKERTEGSKIAKFADDFEKINNINTLHCEFENVEPVNENSDYTSSNI